MQLAKIEDLIGETTEYDKKQAVEVKRPKSWCKSISAFANTEGGALIFGVADDDMIIGLDHAEADAEKVSEIIKSRIMPAPDVNLQFYKTSDGKKLIILQIHKGEETPYYYSADGTTEAYIRIGNESVPAAATDLKRLVLRGRNSSFDSLPSAYSASDYSFTKISLLNNAETFIKINSKTVWKKTDNSRLEFPEYVHRSYFEALVNAFVHRDYLDYGSEVHVDMFDDRLEIYSPGGMFDGTKVQERNIRRIPSRRRNPVLADIFDRLGYMERSGSGFGKILDGYEVAQNYTVNKEPEFYSDSTMFLVTLPNLNYSHMETAKSAEKPLEKPLEPLEKPLDSGTKLSPREMETITKMEFGIEYSTTELSEMLGLKETRTREILRKLAAYGLIRTTAATKNRRYVKVKQDRSFDARNREKN